MITIIIYDSIIFIKILMKDSKEITLFIDTYNSNHSDAILMVANYLVGNKNNSAEITISKKKQISIKTTNNDIEEHIALDFNLNLKTADDLKTFFI